MGGLPKYRNRAFHLCTAPFQSLPRYVLSETELIHFIRKIALAIERRRLRQLFAAGKSDKRKRDPDATGERPKNQYIITKPVSPYL